MASSAGIVITNGKKILGLLSKHKDGWDIPKGKRDNGELDIECAIRECLEETGMEFGKKELEDFGIYDYHNDSGRNLHAFVNFTENLPDIKNMSCKNYVERMGYKIPEVQEYRYIDVGDVEEKFSSHLSPILVKIMEQINNE